MPPTTPADPVTHNSWRWLAPAVLFLLVLVSWTGHLDQQARTVTEEKFTRALAVAALARAFNGAISVAQGTELAIQPVGVGVSLSIGEILDPLNDLVERFALLALIASASLALQLTLGTIVASPWFSGLMTALAIAWVLLFLRRPWQRRVQHVRPWVTRALLAAIFARFLLAVMLLSTHWVDAMFLADIQAQATQGLRDTSASLEQMQQEHRAAPVEDASLLDRTGAGLQQLFNQTRARLDIETQLTAVQDEVEQSVREIINLIVVFLLQTLILPAAALMLCWWTLRSAWQGLARSP